MIVTIGQLGRKRACEDQLTLFKKYFGESVEVTRELCMKHAQEFDWAWAAEHLLEPAAREQYDKARVAAREQYDEACAAALEQYDKARVAAREQYARVHAAAREQYDKARVAAREQYDKVLAAAWEQYNEACAQAFAEGAGT